jgi:hypothetical protein
MVSSLEVFRFQSDGIRRSLGTPRWTFFVISDPGARAKTGPYGPVLFAFSLLSRVQYTPTTR